MASTPVYGFRMETDPEPPAHTLRVDDTFSPDTLAEQVETELIRVEADVSSIGGRVTTLEQAPGWHTLHKANITEPTPFAIESAMYDMIRVHMWGQMDAEGQVCLQVNDDGTAGLHAFAWTAYRLDTGAVQGGAAGDGSLWAVARWGQGFRSNATATIYETDQDVQLSFQGEGYRMSGNTAARTKTLSGGHLTSARLLSSIDVTQSGASFDPGLGVDVLIEGHRSS